MVTQEELLARIDTEGYVILENAIDASLVDALVDDLARLEAELGTKPAGNVFEGEATTRVYNLLAHGGPWPEVPVHPSVLPLAEAVLGGEIQVSTLSSVAIAPGETAQPLHADDQVMPLQRPHAPTVCNSMWALTDFTEANGATRLVPGSHKLDHYPDYSRTYETVAAEMPKGSILLWTGSLWHGGGPNTTSQTRIGVAMNYCAGWIRQQENQQLGIPRDLLESFSPQLKALCGLGIYRGIVGHIDKQTAAQRMFGDDAEVNHLFDKNEQPAITVTAENDAQLR